MPVQMKNHFGEFDPKVLEVLKEAYNSDANSFAESCDGTFDFKTCQRSDGTTYGTAGDCSQKGAKEVKKSESKKSGWDDSNLAGKMGSEVAKVASGVFTSGILKGYPKDSYERTPIVSKAASELFMKGDVAGGQALLKAHSADHSKTVANSLSKVSDAHNDALAEAKKTNDLLARRDAESKKADQAQKARAKSSQTTPQRSSKPSTQRSSTPSTQRSATRQSGGNSLQSIASQQRLAEQERIAPMRRTPTKSTSAAHRRELAKNGGVDLYKGALNWNDGTGMYAGNRGLKSGRERYAWSENRRRAYANDKGKMPEYQGRGKQLLDGKPIGPGNYFDYIKP